MAYKPRFDMTGVERSYVARNNGYILKEMQRNGAFEPLKKEIEQSIRNEISKTVAKSVPKSDKPEVIVETKYVYLNTAEELKERDKYLKSRRRKDYWKNIMARVITWAIIVGIIVLLCNIPGVSTLINVFVDIIKNIFSSK